MKFHFLLSLTGTITASLTVSTLQQNGGIQSLSDVIETTRVGVVNESTAQYFMASRGGCTLIIFTSSNDLLHAFTYGYNYLDAVVDDAPVLIYYTETSGLGIGNVVGSVFEDQNYGIAISNGSPLKKQLNIQLLSLYESGQYDQIYLKWFQSDGSSEPQSSGLLTADQTSIEATYIIVGILSIVIGTIIAYFKYRRGGFTKENLVKENGGEMQTVSRGNTKLQEELRRVQLSIMQMDSNISEMIQHYK